MVFAEKLRLNITLDDNTTRSFSANTIVPIAHSASLNLTKGTLSKTNVRLIESGVKVGNLIWARTNMTYDSGKLYGAPYQKGTSDAYRFLPNNENAYPNVNLHLWNFATPTPDGKDYQTVNPCSRVYPEGTWRAPQELNERKEFSDLIKISHTASIKKVFNGDRYAFTWKGSQPANPAYPDQDLILTFFGYRTSGGSLEAVPNSTGTGMAQYRTNSYSNDRKAIVFYAEVKKRSFGNATIVQKPYEKGVSIRCIRNVINN